MKRCGDVLGPPSHPDEVSLLLVLCVLLVASIKREPSKVLLTKILNCDSIT